MRPETAPRPTVLVTGATGNLGRKLVAHFRAAGYPLRLVCLNPRDETGVVTADLTVWDPVWTSAFEGVDAVLHMAADPSPWADWGSLQACNLDLTANVLAASQAAGVRRVVFASSNFVMAGYRFERGPITTDLPPRPINGYGATKLAGERLGKLFADRFDLSFIALRIGVCLGTEPNRFSARLPFGVWGQGMWLSDRDLCQGFEAAARALSPHFGVYHLMSANPGMRWDIAPMRRDLGYEPEDGELPRPGLGLRLRALGAALRDRTAPRALDRLTGREW